MLTLQATNGNGKATQDVSALRNFGRVLQESIDWLGDLLDPMERYEGLNGEIWTPLWDKNATECVPYHDEMSLASVRDFGRRMALHNEYAICGHENRISYIVGTGHRYAVEMLDAEAEPDEAIIDDVTGWLAEWQRINSWNSRQQETLLRYDRDGEAFLRLFPNPDGFARVRFIEPSQVKEPDALKGKGYASYGIETLPDDAETVIAYWIDGVRVPVTDEVDSNGGIIPGTFIQHRKGCVDATCKRGVPLWYSARKRIELAPKLVMAMGKVVEEQSKIAAIRKHLQGVKANVESMVSAVAVAQRTNSTTGQTNRFTHTRPGTTLDIPANIDFQFPIGQLDPAKPVAAIQAVLRACAARVNMPEFMLTADASNANYSSTMVAEGPSTKQFEREQAKVKEWDAEIIEAAIGMAAASGRLPQDVLSVIKITAEAPRIIARDRLQETQRGAMLYANRAISLETWRKQEDLDHEGEEKRIADEQDEIGIVPGPLPSGKTTTDDGGTGDEPTIPGGLATAAASDASLQATGLNGAQIAALLQVCDKIVDGSLTPEAARAIIGVSFPLIPVEEINRIVGSLKANSRAPAPVQPQVAQPQPKAT